MITVLEVVVLVIKGNLVRDHSLLMKIIHGIKAELVQDHLVGLQEAKGSLAVRDLVEEDYRMYNAIIVRSLIIHSPIAGHRIKILKEVQALILIMK